MQNRLTIKDIARLSGVGKSTVSRVLNNESGVSEADPRARRSGDAAARFLALPFRPRHARPER